MNPAQTEPPELAEIYRTQSLPLALTIEREVLVPGGLEPVVRDRMSQAIPTQTMAGAYFIAVPRAQVAKARELLAEALAAGLIPAEQGELVT